MRILPFIDNETREDILEHVSGYVFDRAAFTRNDEPMRVPVYARVTEREQELHAIARRRSVRR